jgi:hypothetical protein
MASKNVSAKIFVSFIQSHQSDKVSKKGENDLFALNIAQTRKICELEK